MPGLDVASRSKIIAGDGTLLVLNAEMRPISYRNLSLEDVPGHGLQRTSVVDFNEAVTMVISSHSLTAGLDGC
jgi:hypothetical protein